MEKQKIILDENGEIFDEFAERNEQIIYNLNSKVEELKKEQSLDTKGVKRFGFRCLMQIENELMKYPLLPAEKFARLEYDDIEHIWRMFHSLMSYYNMQFEIAPTRQTFMLYAQINSRMYQQLVKGGANCDDDIRDLMIFIEDRLVGSAFTSSTNGNSDVKATNIRLRAKDAGHDIITASESKLIDKVESQSPSEIMKRLQKITNSAMAELSIKNNNI